MCMYIYIYICVYIYICHTAPTHVIRVFVVFNVEMSPAALGNKKRALQSATQPLMRCKRAFQVRNANSEQPLKLVTSNEP